MKATEGAHVRLTADVRSELRDGETIAAGTVGRVLETMATPREGYQVEFTVGEDFDVVAVGPEQIDVVG